MMEGEKMIKKKSNIQPGKNSLAKFKKQQIFYLPMLLFGIILFIMSVSRVYAADNAVYSTVGGTWEKVSDTTWTMDKDGDGNTDVTLVKDGDEWKYIFNVADDSAMYYGWETDIPDGYEVENGYGTKENPAISSQYAHTSNIDKDGVQDGVYEGGVDETKVYTVPGASYVMASGKYDLADGDFLVLWHGNHPEYTAVKDCEKGKKLSGKGSIFDTSFDNDTITVGFHSEKTGKKGYGYYATIKGNTNTEGLRATNTSTEETPLDTGNIRLTKKVEDKYGNSIDTDEVFKFNIEFITEDEEIKKALSGTKVYGDVTLTDGKGSFYMSKDQSVYISGVPTKNDKYGKSLVRFKISEESVSDKYSCVYSGDIDSQGENDFYANNTYLVYATNIKIAEPAQKTQNLVIKKQVKKSNRQDSFRFFASFENLNSGTEYKYKKGEEEKSFKAGEDGTADITFDLSDKEEMVFENLPVNCVYQITEDASDYYASYEISDAVNVVQQKQDNAQANQPLSTGKETVDADENATVTFTNTGKEESEPEAETTKMAVKKIWNDNDNSAGRRPDSITLYLMQDENVMKNITLNGDNGWQAEFDNLDVYQEDGKTKYTYSVQEEKVDGYISKVAESTVGENGESIKLFTVTNTAVSTGAIKVTKTVEGDKAEAGKAFKFNITLQKDGRPVTGVYNLDSKAGTKTGTIVFDENGKASFELKHNESIVISGLPIGASYEIAENPYKYYTASDEGKYSGVIPEGTAEVNVVNTHKEMYSISVTKTVKGNQGDKTKKFDFVLKLTAGDGIELPTAVEYKKGKENGKIDLTNSEAEFKLAHGEEITFKDLPAGIGYEVTESGAENDGYTVSSENASGVVKTNVDVSFVNTKNVGIPTSSMTNTIVMLLIVCIAVCGVVYGVRKRR